MGLGSKKPSNSPDKTGTAEMQDGLQKAVYMPTHTPKMYLLFAPSEANSGLDEHQSDSFLTMCST